jgi:Papain family cysteine protease
MDIHVARAEVLAALPDFNLPVGFGLGAVPLNPDSKLLDLRSLPVIKKALAAGIPKSTDLSQYVKGVYNQGAENSCVVYSLAAVQSVSKEEMLGDWLTFDAEECYKACGGYGPNGVPAPDVLNWEERTGFRDIASNRRYQITSYAHADLSNSGIEALKASIASRHPCVLALLLPSDFGNQFGGSGDCASDTVTNGYHQVCVVGYTADRVTILNSWGSGWGRNGIGTIRWEFLQNPDQQYFAYAYTVSETDRVIARTTMSPGQQLLPGQSLQSNNKLHTFILQQDGNAVLYDRNAKPLWSTNTGGLITPRSFLMQSDGNLVLYSTDGAAHWASNTYGNPGAFFDIQDDGNLVVYQAGSQTETPDNALWAASSNDPWNLSGGPFNLGEVDDSRYSLTEATSTEKS